MSGLSACIGIINKKYDTGFGQSQKGRANYAGPVGTMLIDNACKLVYKQGFI